MRTTSRRRFLVGAAAAMIGRFPNLYFDLAFGPYESVYGPSAQRHARIWNAPGRLDAAWADVIVRFPWRFLDALPDDRTRRIVAHGSAWNLLFGEQRVF